MTTIHFKPLTESDINLMFQWFQKPHIKQWYANNETYTFDQVREKYLPRTMPQTFIKCFIIYSDKTPIGYIQLYKVKDHLPYGELNDNHSIFNDLNASEIAGIDLFIADENFLKKGHATLALKQFIKEHVEKRFTLLLTDPLKINKNAIQFFTRNGFKKFDVGVSSGANELMALHLSPTNQDTKIILTTPRLILRTWHAYDVSLMAAINSDPKVMEYFPSTQDLVTTQALVERFIQHYKDFGYAAYAVEIKDTQEFIGFVGLNHPSFVIPNFQPQSLPIVEIGWRLSADHWGQGYATEAAKAVIDYAFTELNLGEIISFAVVANLKSRRVMEKIGLHHADADDFDHPKLSETSPLRRHVLYRVTKNVYNAR